MRINHFLTEYINVNQDKFVKRWTLEGKPYEDIIMPTEESNPVVGFTNFLEQADPTQNKKYVNWMITRYLRGDVRRLEDFPARITNALEYYDRLKRKKKLESEHTDINKIKDIEEVVQYYKKKAEEEGSGDLASKREKEKSIEQQMYDEGDAKLVYNDSEFKIVVPVSHKASCYFGKNTRWCTTGTASTYHDMYSRQGPLYIILHKPTNTRWQFHFGSQQYMDEEDDPINVADFFAEHPKVMKVLMKAEPDEVKKVSDAMGGLYRFASALVTGDGQPVSIDQAIKEIENDRVLESVIDDFLESKGLPEIGYGLKPSDPSVIRQDDTILMILEVWPDIHRFAADLPGGDSRAMSLKDAFDLLDDPIAFENDYTNRSEFVNHVLSPKNEQAALLKAHEILDKAGVEYDEDADLNELLDEHDYELDEIDMYLQDAEREGQRLGAEGELMKQIENTINQFATSYDATLMFGTEENMSSDFTFDTRVNLVITWRTFDRMVLDDDSMVEELQYVGSWMNEEFLETSNYTFSTHHLDYAGFDEDAANEIFAERLGEINP